MTITPEDLVKISAFLEQVNQMTPADFEIVHDHYWDVHEIVRGTRQQKKLSAADSSQLTKFVQDKVGAHWVRTQWITSNHSELARLSVMWVAQVLLHPEKFSAQEYEAHVGGYRLAGLSIPPHAALPAAEG